MVRILPLCLYCFVYRDSVLDILPQFLIPIALFAVHSLTHHELAFPRPLHSHG